MISGVTYAKIDDAGLHYIENSTGRTHILQVDNIIICAGQLANNNLYQECEIALSEIAVNNSAPNTNVKKVPELHIIGGASNAHKLDAKLAISEGAFLAAKV